MTHNYLKDIIFYAYVQDICYDQFLYKYRGLEMKKSYCETEEILEYVRHRLEEYGVAAKAVTAVSLCVEEILYRYSQTAASDTPVLFEVRRNSRELSVIVSISGEECPLSKNENDYSILDKIVEKMNFKFSHKYASGMNTDYLVVEKYSRTLGDLKFSLHYMGKSRKHLFGGLATHIVSILANLVIPYLSGVLIVAYTNNTIQQIIFVAVSITIARCIYIVFFKATNILYSKASFNMQHSIHKKLIQELFLVQDEILDEKGTGPFVTMINSDSDIISNGLSTIADLFSEGMYYVGVLIAIFIINKVAFIMALALIIVLLILEKIRAHYLDIDKRKSYTTLDRTSGMVYDIVNGVKEVKNLNAEKCIETQYIEADIENTRNNDQRNTRTQILSALNNVTMYIFFGAVLIYLGKAINSNRLEPAYALVLFNYFTMIGIPVIALVQRAIDFAKDYNLACERVRNFLEGSEYSRESFGNTISKKINGAVDFQNVSFIYNYNNPLEADNPVLKGINLLVHPGEKLALVGASGCGKSTTLKLVNRQRDCTGGAVTLDGINTMEYDKDTLRGNISVVSQQPYIFNATVKENLLFAKPDATMEELEGACRKACILDDILRMPRGFNTGLGEKAMRLSGGQAQRLAIARAFLKNTPVLILDEATSALDNITQKSIMDNIAQSNQTVMMIAHRLSSIKDADRIAVLSDGKIIAEGTHKVLMDSCEQYRLLYQSENKA